MQSPSGFSIRPATRQVPTDAELQSVLHQVYVGEGFTTEEMATEMFLPQAVRQRGKLLVAVDEATESVGGLVIYVPPGSAAQQIATEEAEAEIHLLAVLPSFRGKGMGRALVASTLERARADRCESVILWTQPTMQAAHRLYAELGFQRLPDRDFHKQGIDFMVMRIEL